MFLRGRVTIQGGSVVPNDMLVERVCNNRTRQQVYASSHGDFSMQLGSRIDSFPEASPDSTSSFGANSKDSSMGVPHRDLVQCELRASAFGFHPRILPLLGLDSGENVDVGVIVVNRATKIDGSTVSAIPYKAPKEARIAYEKGMQAEKKAKLADAQKYFEAAVKIYPNSANAWFQLGDVLQKEKQNDPARKAFTQATTIDTKFLPPYLSLASMAYETANWAEVLTLTNHILGLDPLNHAAVANYILDLDPMNLGDAYFYNAMANYKLHKIDDAERSALQSEHLDLRTHFPQLHLLLAEIFAGKSQYGMAIAQMETYLELAPQAQDADHVREQLAQLQKLNGSSNQ
jgi:tetratricopeptide (TPR) repeat protein